MTRTFEYEDVSIVFEHMGKCYHAAQKEAGRNPEYWDAGEAKRFRELLADGHPSLARFDEDKLRRCAVSFRKKGDGLGGWKDYKKENNIQGKRGGNGTCSKKTGDPVVISPELQAHYKTDFYGYIKDQERAEARGRCRICNDPLEEFHHRDYSNIGKPEESHDVIAVCKICHSACDTLRREAVRRRNNNK
jgi:hypothetical protein